MKIYHNFIIIDDFNSEMTESAVENYCGTHHLHKLIKYPIFFKNPDKPSCIVLILTNFFKVIFKITSLRNCFIGFP